MRKLGIASLLILVGTASLAQSDSTKLYPIERWRLDRLLHAYFYVLPSCDTTVTKLQTALDSLKLTLQASQNYTKIIIQQRDNKAAEAEARKQKEINKDALHESQIKTEKKKGNKKGLAGVIVGVVITVLLL